MRKLTKTTIKPVLTFVRGWGANVHSMNTRGAQFYGFTLDTYNGKNSFQGGFDWSLEDALRYGAHAIELATGNVYDRDQNIVMTVELAQ